MADPNVEVDVLDRLPTPLGLIRSGVAPDHPSTKLVGDALGEIARSPRFHYLLGVNVGEHVSDVELAQNYSAVVYAHGASASKVLGIAGEHSEGSVTATEFVAWYNGHPDFADRRFDLSAERVVVIGNGNVALDVARVLLTDPEVLARTDIADHALEALRGSAVREVVLLGRRGLADAAFTIGELAALSVLGDVDVILDEGPDGADSGAVDAVTATKLGLLREIAARSTGNAERRLVFRFHTRLVAVLAPFGSVTAVEVATGAATDCVETPLVIRSIGYTGEALKGLPFDEVRGVVPNRGGRVIDPVTGATITATYVAGWIKRGSAGGIGANRRCGEETARAVLDDAATGVLTPRPDRGGVADLAFARGAVVVDAAAWDRIDAAERAAGAGGGRPRVKLTDIDALNSAAGVPA